MEHSGCKIVGTVQAEKLAIQTYEIARSQGKTAALVLQEEPDIFQTKVGNVPPKTSITVTLTYITPLKQDTESNAVRFTLPTFIAPRYGDPDSNANGNVATSRMGFELTLDVTMPSQITSVSSPSHQITINLTGPTSASVTFSNLTPSLAKDVVILLAAKDIDEPRCVIETNPSTGTKCAMFTLVPKFNLPRAATEVIFIIDRSGSMQDKVNTLKRALHLFLKSLPANPEIYFNICSFGSHFDYLFKDGKSKRYDSKSLETAEKYVTKIQANYGGTEILQPLLDSMKNRRIDCQTSIILLTDGEVYDTRSIIASVSQEREKTFGKSLRIFSLGIGSAVSHHLVEGLARAGGGYCQVVMEQERLDKKVVRMLSAGLQTSLNDLRLDWAGKSSSTETVYTLCKSGPEDDFEVVETHAKTSITFFDESADDAEVMQCNPPPEPATSKLVSPTIQQFPEIIPPLYNLSRHVTYLQFPASYPIPRDITLRGTTPDGSELSLNIPVTEINVTDLTPPIVHILASRTLLGELQEGRLTVQKENADDDSLTDAVAQEGIRIGVKWGLASKWTSFVAVNEQNPEIKLVADGHLSADNMIKRGEGLVHGSTSPRLKAKEIGGGVGDRRFAESGYYRAISLNSTPAPPPQYQTTGFGSTFAVNENNSLASRSAACGSSTLTTFGSSRSATKAASSGFGASGFGSFGSFGSSGSSGSSGPALSPPSGSRMRSFGVFKARKTIQTGFAAPAPPPARARSSPFQPVCNAIEYLEPAVADISGSAPGVRVTTDEEKLHQIVMLQSSSGMFPSSVALARQLGFKTLVVLNAKLPVTLGSVAAEVWMTALACAFLETNLPKEKEAWELVVEKAWAYVVSVLDATKTDEIKKAAIEAISA